ncbi:MAG: MurR/RpiR family transcriptional regulator, partial [Lachnospiraceae bacterium]|nr:MurR/RpiR family transcriptional regulator [Lachnospiraceae bacterium]
SSAAEFADVLLICGHNENPLEGGSVATKMSLLFIIDCLYELYCQKDPEQAAHARSTTALALTRSHT